MNSSYNSSLHHDPPPLDRNSDLFLSFPKANAFQPASVLHLKVDMKACFPKCYGEFTDGFLGEVDAAEDIIPNHVAIKHVRLHPNDTPIRELVVSKLPGAIDKWSSKRHPNICPMWSVTSSTEPMPAVAMPWFNNGSILDYMQQDVVVDKLDIVKQVASAVAYVHDMGEVHANITPMNVMITDDGRACLSDIGLNICLRHAIYRDRWLVPSSWMFKSPEELVTQDDPSSFKPTKAMDVYAFASTAYSILTSKPPFSGQPYRGIWKIMARSHKLDKPTEIEDPLWELLHQCWSFIPEDRPSMITVKAALARM